MPKKGKNDTLEKRIERAEAELARLKSADRKIRESEERLYQILQGSTIPTFVIDKHHIITHCNKAYENLTGISASDIIGTNKHWRTFYPTERPVLADFVVDGATEEEFARYYGDTYRKSAVSEGGYEAESFFPNLGDNGKWLFFTASPLRDSQGNITGALETLQDVTERKLAEEAMQESERRVRILLDFVPYPIVVFTLDGRVYYLNPAFTETFGWTLRELQGKKIPYSPPGLEQETAQMIKKLMKEKVILGHETKRLTKDGRVLDVIMRAAVYSEAEDEPAGELVLLRDITREKQAARNNEAILRISMALPEYPDLEDLLDYVSNEVKRLLESEGSLVILRDEEKDELFFLGAAYDDTATQRRVKEIRFNMDQLVAGRVIRSGKPIIVNDASEYPELSRERDKKLGYHTRNLLLVPLRSSDRIIGVLSAINKKEGDFHPADNELLSMIASTVALSIENARFSEDLKKALRSNEALLRISMALPEYPDLEELLDYVSNEVKRLLESEGSLVILRDEEKDELFFLGAAYDDTATQKRVKEIRFPQDQLVAGRVIESGKPIMVNDASEDPELSRERDKKLGYHTRNLLLVPLRSSDRIIGVLCAINKKEGDFLRADSELLSLIAGTVALSIENARFSEELKGAYREVSSLNRAKDKVINHLSHELKTPVSILTASLNILAKKAAALPEDTWKRPMDRAKRNLDRILDIQEEVDDIMQGKDYRVRELLSSMLDECADELEGLIAEEVGEGPVIQKVRDRIEEIFGLKELTPEAFDLAGYVEKRLQALKPLFKDRELDIITDLSAAPRVFIPEDPLQKTVDGLIKNAIENTPDEGKIEITVGGHEAGTLLTVRDFGVGITNEHQQRIFEGFFSTQETMDYSSKRPFDFNAGGKGADLLRMKIFSERYHFQIHMVSDRCRFIPGASDVCPGRISQCRFCKSTTDCHDSGGTVFTLRFPPAPEGASKA
jgi:PAS domain S-box-containing protein